MFKSILVNNYNKFDNSSNPYNTPYFSSMLKELEYSYDIDYFGYMNGDLLLHSSIVSTMKTVLTERRSLSNQNKIMLVGRRYNIKTTINDNYQSFSRSEYDSIIEKKTKFTDMFISVAIDLFIFSRGSLNYDDYIFSKLVIGRNKYDNYMIDYAIEKGISLVDISYGCKF